MKPITLYIAIGIPHEKAASPRVWADTIEHKALIQKQYRDWLKHQGGTARVETRLLILKIHD